MKKFLPIIGLVILLTLFVAPAASAAPPAWGPDCGGAHHCVRWGETLHSIGRMYNVDPNYIAHVNGLHNPNRIFAGQILYIPADGPPYPWNALRWGDCWGDDCGSGHRKPTSCWGDDCGSGHPKPTPYYDRGYGYDYSGYYYEGYYPKYKRYSYTCGYNQNCY